MEKKKIITIISILLGFILAFHAGMAWYAFQYEDWCLSMGGGKNPGNYEYCVVKILEESEQNHLEKIISVEPNNGIGNGVESLDELLQKDKLEDHK